MRVQFADDTVLINKKKGIKNSLKKLQSDVAKITEYFDSIGLEIAPEKSQLVIFSKTKIKEKSHQIKIQDHIVYNQQHVKYLGLIIDSKLQWNEHAKYIIDKTIKLMNILKVLRGTWWGGNSQTLLIVYRGLIRSTMEYNAFLIKVED